MSSSLESRLQAAIRERCPAGRVLVAIDGEDGAGKTVLADRLASHLVTAGEPVLRASIDGFHRPRAERYARGRTSPEGFYRDSYDLDAFRRELIDPFRRGAPVRSAVFDVRADAPVRTTPQATPVDCVLIVDGIFLHRPELRGLWDWSLWLEVAATERFARMAVRDDTDPDPTHPGNLRYFVGQQLYRAEVGPEGLADAVVDNTDHAHPVVVRGC